MVICMTKSFVRHKRRKKFRKGNSLNIYHITHVICCNVIEMAALPYRVKCQRFPLLAHKWHSYAVKIIPGKCEYNRKEERMELKMNNTCFFERSKRTTKCLIFAERYFCRAIRKNCLLRRNKLKLIRKTGDLFFVPPAFIAFTVENCALIFFVRRKKFMKRSRRKFTRWHYFGPQIARNIRVKIMKFKMKTAYDYILIITISKKCILKLYF